MRAVLLTRYGDDGLELGDAPLPDPGEGRVRVRVEAVAVNPFDVRVRDGGAQGIRRLTLPAVIGSEVAGTVDAVGDGVQGLAVGDRVAGWADGGAFAEYAVTRATKLAVLPPGLEPAQAVAVPTAFETATRAIAPLGVRSGETVVVHGGSGAVGSMAVQLLVGAGARVIATGGAGSRVLLATLGATPTTYGTGVAERIRALAPEGVDAVLDAAGHGFVATAIELRGGTDRIVTIADEGAEALGVPMSTSTGRGQTGEAIRDALRRVADGGLRVVVDRAAGLAALPAAVARLAAGRVRGKAVVTLG